MDEELITIVVPIYNIENYIQRCVDSILTQTYSNIEVLLVNDGSTDGSRQKCEQYKDKRVKVFNKPNGGLSDARNYGLKRANGKYIVFIDGDDFVHNDMIKILYENLVEADADMSVCSFQYFYDSGLIKDYYIHNDINEVVIMDKEKAILSMLNHQLAFRQCAWNKLYKIELFQNIEYPFGKLYEDMGTTYKLILESNRVVYTHKNLYYYVQRGNSITKTFQFNQRELDRIEMVKEFAEHVIKAIPNLKDPVNQFKVMQYIAVSNVMIRSNSKDKNLIKKTKVLIKENFLGILKYSNIKEKMQIILYYINFSLYQYFFLKSIKKG